MNRRGIAKINIEDGIVHIGIPIKELKNLLRGTERVRKANWSILKSIRGMWRNKKIDALAYQKTLRKEWS
jgi:hypothetical protein